MKTGLFCLICFSIPLLFSHCTAPKTSMRAPYYSPGPLPAIDASKLKGHLIVLDPGHGGAMPGAIGKAGLMEKDINLEVALRLRKKLTQAGARVVLTRETDRDFLPKPGAHVREDLKRRTDIADSILPDLFVSIHHNAEDAKDTIPDTTKTFYKMGDTGPSLDAAIYIHKYFTTMLGMAGNNLSMGNYFVLRNTHVPAVLGEPSYISTAEVEAVLKNPAKLEIEADAYFRGIAEWFKNGFPKITYLDYDSSANLLMATVQSDADLNPNAGEFILDGKRLPFNIEGNRILAPISGILENGYHTATLRVVNTNGNSSSIRERKFGLNRLPVLLNVFYNPPVGRAGQIVPVRVSVSDALGMPVMDGTLISSSLDQKTITRNGRGTLYPVYGKQSKLTVTCGDAACEFMIKTSIGSFPVLQGFVKSGNNALRANLLCYPGGIPTASDENGFFECPDSIKQIKFSCMGYQDTLVEVDKSKTNQILLKKFENGILFGKRIVLDPEFGGLENGGTGPSGERASDINRLIAENTRTRLQKAGAVVVMAREGDRSVTVSDRIELANEPLADVYILIHCDTDETKPYVAHYPNSQFGGNLSQAIIKAAMRDFNPERREIINFITQQTPCTCAMVSFVSTQLTNPMDLKRIDGVSESIFNGLLLFFKTPF